jgi:hydroxymethylglutaryl-CoA lyase
MNQLYLTECPRDAMQGIVDFIPTNLKVDYLNQLLKCGFDVLDFGSFVSPKAIPQMQDTASILPQLKLDSITTKLLAIIANERGAQDAAFFDEVSFLGFPFSVSETFQQRNTNSSIEASLKRVEAIQQICEQNNKQQLVYLSMAFGNPYGDLWHEEVVAEWAQKLKSLGIKYFALADTTGSSTPATVSSLIKTVVPELTGLDVSLHLHSTRDEAVAKITAALAAGCTKFDVAIHGFGGCPMAKKDLTGNLATEDLLEVARTLGYSNGLNANELDKAYAQSWTIFNNYH